MGLKKLADGKWQCDFYLNGRGSKRVRKTFITREEAINYEKFMMAEIESKP